VAEKLAVAVPQRACTNMLLAVSQEGQIWIHVVLVVLFFDGDYWRYFFWAPGN
jgi:hypothetical protein